MAKIIQILCTDEATNLTATYFKATKSLKKPLKARIGDDIVKLFIAQMLEIYYKLFLLIHLYGLRNEAFGCFKILSTF